MKRDDSVKRNTAVFLNCCRDAHIRSIEVPQLRGPASICGTPPIAERQPWRSNCQVRRVRRSARPAAARSDTLRVTPATRTSRTLRASKFLQTNRFSLTYAVREVPIIGQRLNRLGSLIKWQSLARRRVSARVTLGFSSYLTSRPTHEIDEVNSVLRAKPRFADLRFHSEYENEKFHRASGVASACRFYFRFSRRRINVA